MGSLGGVLLFWLFHRLPPWLYIVTIIGLTFLGTWAADRAEEKFQQKDCRYIVIDEIAGFLVTAFLMPWEWPWMAAAFFLFRLFDVVKPFPARQAENLHGGIGIMTDDLIAGLYANLILQVIRLCL